MQCRPTGLIRVDFHDGETLSFNPLVTTIQHIILGSHYIDHYGTLHVRSSCSALSTKVRFKEPVIGPPQHKVQFRSLKVPAHASGPVRSLVGIMTRGFHLSIRTAEPTPWEVRESHYIRHRWACKNPCVSNGCHMLERGRDGQVKGFVEKEGKRQSFPQLHGTWDGAFSATWEDGLAQLLWQKNPPHEHPSRCWPFLGDRGAVDRNLPQHAQLSCFMQSSEHLFHRYISPTVAAQSDRLVTLQGRS